MGRHQHQQNNKGLIVEKNAARWLCQQGLTTVTNNYRGKRGEIDLVMIDNDTLVFVEVRYRSSNSYGSAIETVDSRKQQKLMLTAQHYVTENPEQRHRMIRFDVIGASTNHHGSLDFEWIKNAFSS